MFNMALALVASICALVSHVPTSPFLLARENQTDPFQQSLAATKVHTVPAELIGPYLVVEGKVNGKNLRLMLDTGAGMNVLTPGGAKKLGIEGGTAIQAQGAGASVQAKIVALESWSVGGAESSKPRALVVPLPEVLECDGLVGFGTLESLVTRIDYDGRELSFFPPKGFQPPEGFVSVPLRVKGGIPEVRLTVKGVEGWAKLDTGASDMLTLFKGFVDKHGLREGLKVEKTTGGLGVGGFTSTDQAELEGISIGGMALPKATVFLSNQTRGAFADEEALGNIGGDLLRRFTVILDYAAGKAYLKKGAQFSAPQLVNRTGLGVLFDGKRHNIFMVASESPAARAGVKVGEAVVALNGRPVTELKALEVWASLRQAPGTKVKLRIAGKDAEREVELVLEDY